MATIHVDLYNGSDVNDGSSWALARKTIPIGQDTNDYKIAKTPPGVLQDYNATWNENLPYVELDSPKTLLLTNCSTAWTRSVSSYNAYSTGSRKVSTAATGISFGLSTAYPLGKMGHLSLPTTVDGSAYRKLGFWFYSSTYNSSVVFQIRLCLCSDTAGDVILQSFYLQLNARVGWNYIIWDLGAPFPSNINSIALYMDSRTTSTFTCAFAFNNLNFCEDLHCNKLISNQSGYLGYRAIKYIEGTRVYLEDNLLTNSEPTKKYGGDSYYGPVYLLEPFIEKGIVASDALYNKNDVIGGYNTSTDEVDGYTFFDEPYGLQQGCFRPNSYNKVLNFGFSRFSSAIRLFVGPTVSNCIFVCCKNAVEFYGGNPSFPEIYNCYAYGLGTAFLSASNIDGLTMINLNLEASTIVVSCTTYSSIMYQRYVTMLDIIAKNTALFSFGRLINGLIRDCYSSGENLYSTIVCGCDTIILDCEFAGTISSSSFYHRFDCMSDSIISNCNFSGTVRGIGTQFHNCSFPSSFVTSSQLQVTNYNKVAGDNKKAYLSGLYAYNIQYWQTAIKKNPDDLGAWCFSWTSYGNIRSLYDYRKIFDFAYLPGQSITISFWVRHYSTTSFYTPSIPVSRSSKYTIFSDIANGVLEDIEVISVESSEWVQVTLQFSAAVAGIYSVFISPQAYSITVGTQAVIVSSLEISQA